MSTKQGFDSFRHLLVNLCIKLNYSFFLPVEDKNPKGIYGLTPFHIAAREGHLEICKLIISKIKNKSPKDNFGWAPLHYATLKRHYNVCQFLVSTIKDPNPKNLFGQTPLDFALDNNDTKLIHLLSISLK